MTYLHKKYSLLIAIALMAGCQENNDDQRMRDSRSRMTEPAAVLEASDVNSLPVASISLKGTGEICSGILIEKHLVLTAAHCFHDGKKNTEPTAVIIRENNQRLSERYEVLSWGESDFATWDYKDIAWVKLKKNAENVTVITIGVRKVITDQLPVGTKLKAFGQISNKWLDRTIIALDMTTVGAAGFDDLKSWELPTELNPQMLPGDSGGPLVIKQDNKWLLVGVLQGEKHYSGVLDTSFTAVQPFLPEITAALGGKAPATEEIK